jgi:hypothetical protein
VMTAGGCVPGAGAICATAGPMPRPAIKGRAKIRKTARIECSFEEVLA